MAFCEQFETQHFNGSAFSLFGKFKINITLAKIVNSFSSRLQPAARSFSSAYAVVFFFQHKADSIHQLRSEAVRTLPFWQSSYMLRPFTLSDMATCKE
jgi:hypothetical protein